MHTVPQVYLAEFADPTLHRRQPAVWRFQRGCGDPTLVTLVNASVEKDFYTLTDKEGNRNTGVEQRVLDPVEREFARVRRAVHAKEELDETHPLALARFISYQLTRTPRAFQLLRDAGAHEGLSFDQNAPTVVMISLASWISNWLSKMDWILSYNETDYSFFTSDNPVVMWRDLGDGPEIGVGFLDSATLVSCPLSPTVAFCARHTERSLIAVRTTDARPDAPLPQREFMNLNVWRHKLDAADVKKLNVVFASNADKYIYANSQSARLRRFLSSRFVHSQAPVRRRDRRPVGSI